MALSLGDTRANGAVNATLGDKPRVDVALSTNNLDLDAMLAAAAPPGKAAEAATEQGGQAAPKPAPAAETPAESAAFTLPQRPEERRVGKEGVSTWRSRGSPSQ